MDWNQPNQAEFAYFALVKKEYLFNQIEGQW